MAAASYSTDLTTITTADTTTGVTEPTNATAGGNPIQETDYFLQGTNCVTKSFNATGVGGLAYTAGAAITIPTDGAVFIWTYHGAPNSIDTKTNGGIRLIAGNAPTAYYFYYDGGSDTYTYGGWVNRVVNPATATPSATGAGTPNNTWLTFGWAINNLNALGQGRPFALDCVRYGRGSINIINGEAGSYGTFAGAAAFNDRNNTTANSVQTLIDSGYHRLGILQLVDENYKFKGRLGLGTTATPVDFRDQNVNITIQDTEFCTANFNQIEVLNSSSIVSLTNVNILALGTIAPGNFTVSNNANVTLTSCTFTDMGTFEFLSNTTVTSSTFRRCARITHGNAAISQSIVTDTTANVALITNNPSLIEDTAFIMGSANSHALEISSTGTFTLSGITFENYGANSSNAAAVYNNSGGAVTLNISGGGSIPTVRNGTSASTTIVAANDIVITGLKSDSEVRAYVGTDPATATEVGGVESSGTSFTFSHSVAGQAGYIQIFHVEYQPIYLSITYQAVDIEIPVQQITDRQYERGTTFAPG